jgi:GntR family transcriptional regulator
VFIKPLQIDKTSPIPLYHQLRTILEKQIQEGKFQLEQDFPSELELCELYSVSRTTVRQTFRELLSDGILYRKHPRGRLLLVPVKVSQNLTRLQGFFTKDALNAGIEPETTVLSIGEVKRADIHAELGLQDNERVYCIQRLFCGGGEPLVSQISYIPEKVLPNLQQLDLTKSLFSFIEHEQGQPIVKAKQKIETRLPSRKEKELLQLSPKETIFQVNRTSFTENGAAVEYFECILRGNRYQFVMDLQLDK